MRREAVVCSVLLAAVAAAAAFGACTSGSRMPHGGSPGVGSAPLSGPATQPGLTPGARTTTVGSAGSAVPGALPEPPAAHASSRSEPSDAGAPSPDCAAPTVELDKPPEGSIVFNNAMTALDAGSLDRTAGVVATMQEHHAQLGCCLARWSLEHPAGGLELVVSLTIEPNGVVREATVPADRGTAVDAATAECVLGVVRPLRFPASPAGRVTTADYPLRIASRRP